MVESLQEEIAKPLRGVISDRKAISAILQDFSYQPDNSLVFDFPLEHRKKIFGLHAIEEFGYIQLRHISHLLVLQGSLDKLLRLHSSPSGERFRNYTYTYLFE